MGKGLFQPFEQFKRLDRFERFKRFKQFKRLERSLRFIMLSSIIILIILSIFLGTAAWLIFIWSVKKGEYDDIERPKYRMLEDDEETEANAQDNADKDESNL